MRIEQKEQLLSDAKGRVLQVQEVIDVDIIKNNSQLLRYNGSKDPVSQKLAFYFAARIDELNHLAPSPFFVRCDVVDEFGTQKQLYFAKHQLIEQQIFSWTAPAARLRFFDIGEVKYSVNDRSEWIGLLTRKDQFAITNSKIVFMTSEASDYARTMVYQEQLSKRKAGFILPEIVERMERAQDDVVRANHQGSFLIAGPAGSGKTTLAFHRIAFLLQSPDTAPIFSQDNVIVFVQDDNTQKYFCQLLPDLGLHHVTVTTFASWAFERLGLIDYHFIRRPNGIDSTIDDYESHKLDALRSMNNKPSSNKDIFQSLNAEYQSHFTVNDEKLFIDQQSKRELDRIDITILLTKLHQQNRCFTYQEEYFQQKKSFEITRKTRTTPLVYAFMVLDEIQNYLPEQVTLLRSCIDDKTKAMLYVGDLGQRVLLGTLDSWLDVGEDFSGDRKVVLDKVYRSTKPIMQYIKSLGFDVAVPDELREGSDVIEKVFINEADEKRFVTEAIDEAPNDAQIGILAFKDSDLVHYHQHFANNKNVHVLTVHQSQGVEFDRVFIVGIKSDLFQSTSQTSPERTHLQRDLIYVALTRAMDELTVVGSSMLRECLVP